MKKYKTIEAGSVERINEILREESLNWKPIFITPVNEVDQKGKQKIYFYFLITFESLE